MRKKNPQILFVSDDARVIRTSELRELYRIAGDQRTVAEALGVSVSTVCRALGGSPAEKAPRAERVARVKEIFDERIHDDG